MKIFHSKIFLSVFLFVLSTPLLAQDCANTPNTGAPLSLALPVAHCQQWNVQLNQNFTALNNFAGGVVLLNPTTTQTVNQPSSTALNVNALQLYGTVPNLQFGTLAGTPTGYLTEIGGGSYSFDASIPGDGQGTLALSKVNAGAGYVYNGGAGVTTGNCLVAGSDSSRTFTPQPCVNASTVFYQTVDANGTAQAQRSALNFGTAFALTDSTSPSRTTVNLAATGVTAGSYANPTITIDALGRILSAASGGGGTGSLTGNGYWTFPGGLIVQWMTSATDFPNNARIQATETWPTPFPNGCFVVQATPHFDTTVTANFQGVSIYVNPGDCKTSVNLYGEVRGDGSADSNYHAFLVAIGY